MARVITTLHESAIEQEAEMGKLREILHGQDHQISQLRQLLGEREEELERLKLDSSNGSTSNTRASLRGSDRGHKNISEEAV
jgi:hypothetical protein